MRAIVGVFSRPVYAAFGLAVSFALFLFVAWFPNRELMLLALTSSTLSFWTLFFESHRFFAVNQNEFGSVLTVLTVALSGLYFPLLAFYLRRGIVRGRTAGFGVFGSIMGMLGVGCAACNSIILSSVIGAGAAAGFVGILPFRGVEIGLLGIVILIASIFLIARKIQEVEICTIKS